MINQWKLGATGVMLLTLAAPVGAAVDTQGHWRMGDDDAGTAIIGNNLYGVTDISGNSRHMEAKWGDGITYSSDTRSGTGFSAVFNGTTALGLADLGIVTTATDNFGIEVIVKTTSTSGTQYILSNGADGESVAGYAIVATGGNYALQYSGRFYGLAPSDNVATGDEWTHLALVRDSATFGTRAYINGVLFAEHNPDATPIAPDREGDRTLIGGFSWQPSPPGAGYVNQGFSGAIDEARIFTFNSGEFQPNDLLVVPEPASLGILAMGAGLMMRRRR